MSKILEEKNQMYSVQISYSNELSNLRNQLLEKDRKIMEINSFNAKNNEEFTKANSESIKQINSLSLSLEEAKKEIEDLSKKYNEALTSKEELKCNLSKQTSECDKLINCMKLAASEKEALQGKLKTVIADFELLKAKTSEAVNTDDCEAKSISDIDHESKSITLDSPAYQKYRMKSAFPKRPSPTVSHQKTNFTIKGATLSLQKTPQYYIYIRKSKHMLNHSAASALPHSNAKYMSE